MVIVREWSVSVEMKFVRVSSDFVCVDTYNAMQCTQYSMGGLEDWGMGDWENGRLFGSVGFFCEKYEE